jgi:hypothetical protein
VVEPQLCQLDGLFLCFDRVLSDAKCIRQL